MSNTHFEIEGGVRVLIQHCEYPGCDIFLGVNYPSDFCDDHHTTQKGYARE